MKINKKLVIILIIIYIIIRFTILMIPTLYSQRVEVKKDLVIEDEYISFIDGKTKIIYYNNYQEDYGIKYGDTFNINKSELEKITNKYHNPSSFNYSKYMLSEGVTYQLDVSQYSKGGHHFSVVNYLKNIRFKQIEKIKVIYPDISTYINALVFGQNDLDDDIYTNYNQIGVSHLFAISGTHVILIVSFLKAILSRMHITLKKINFILLIILPIYTIMAGLGHSVIRASMMIILQILFDGKVSKLKIFIFVLLINLIINPFAIFSLGFKLSYIITFMLLVVSPSIKIDNYFLKSIVISICTSLSVLPILINTNYTFNIFLIFTNIIYIPLVIFFLLPLSFMYAILHIHLLENIYLLIVHIMEGLANFLNIFTVNIGHINIIIVLIYYCLLIYLLYLMIIKRIVIKQYLYYLLLTISSFFININILGHVYIIDVGQGDSIMIEMPFNQGNILIDTGPKKSSQEVIDFMQYKAVNKLDAVFLTHYHLDHDGGYVAVSNNFEIDQTINFEKQDHNIELENPVYVTCGDQVMIDKLNFQVLAPCNFDSNNENNNSLVMSVVIGQYKWMFSGDMEEEIEQQLVEYYNAEQLDIDYLKVAHHGSKTSTTKELLDLMTPSKAFISVGNNNMFSHPSPEVIARLESDQVEIHMTKDEGLITIPFK